MKENVVERLFTADNVVIFGQSLGITDSDYFKPYFYGIIEGKIKRQNFLLLPIMRRALLISIQICKNMA